MHIHNTSTHTELSKKAVHFRASPCLQYKPDDTLHNFLAAKKKIHNMQTFVKPNRCHEIFLPSLTEPSKQWGETGVSLSK